jgi:hypothetical protein
MIAYIADPVTLIALTASALASGVGAAAQAGVFGGKSPTPAPVPSPSQAAPPISSPTGSAGDLKSGQGQPSFLAAAAAPQSQNIAGTTSLLGQ